MWDEMSMGKANSPFSHLELDLMECGFSDCCMKQKMFSGCKALTSVQHEQQLLKFSFIIQASVLHDMHCCSTAIVVSS